MHAGFLSMIPKLYVEFFVMSNLITAKFQKLKLLRSKLPASERKRVNYYGFTLLPTEIFNTELKDPTGPEILLTESNYH